jgi:hypothetical protein
VHPAYYSLYLIGLQAANEMPPDIAWQTGHLFQQLLDPVFSQVAQAGLYSFLYYRRRNRFGDRNNGYSLEIPPCHSRGSLYIAPDPLQICGRSQV